MLLLTALSVAAVTHVLLLTALSVAAVTHVTVVTHGAVLHTELKTGKNKSVELVESLRKKLMSGNYDYIAANDDYLHDELSTGSWKVRAQDDDVDRHDEQYKRNEQRHSKDRKRYYNDRERNNNEQLLEMQRYLPPDIQDDENVKMRHDDHVELMRKKHHQLRNEEISGNEHDKRTLKHEKRNDIGQVNLDKIRYDKGDELDDKRNDHAGLRYDNRNKVHPGDKDKHPGFGYGKRDEPQHINREHNKSDKLRYDKYDDLQRDDQRHVKSAEWYDKGEDLKQDKVDNLGYKKKRIDFHHIQVKKHEERSDELNKDRTEKQYRNTNVPDDQQIINIQLGKKITQFRIINRQQKEPVEPEHEKHEMSDQKRDNKYLKLRPDNDWKPFVQRHDERDSEHSKKLIYDNDKMKYEKLKGEELRHNDHEPYDPDRLSQNDREDFRQDDMRHNKPFKTRFKKRHNVRSEELRTDDPDNFGHNTRYKNGNLRHDKHNMLRNDNRDHYRHIDEGKMMFNKRDEREGFRDDEQKYDKTNKLRHGDRDVFRENDMVDDKTDRLSQSSHNNLQTDDKTYDSKHFQYNKPENLQHINKKDLSLDDKREHELHVQFRNKASYDHEHDTSDSDSQQESFGDKLGSKKKQTKSEHVQPIQYDKMKQNIGNNKQSLNQKQDTSDHNKQLPEDLRYNKLGGKQIQVTVAHDKLEQDLEREILRFDPTSNDKRDRYENYDSTQNKEKHTNQKYPNDKYNNDRNNNNYNYRNKKHDNTDLINTWDKREHTSVTNSVNSAYVPREHDNKYIDNDNYQSIDNDNYERSNGKVDNGKKEQQSDIRVSTKDLMYYVDDEKLAQRVNNASASTLVNDNPKKFDKKFKILKIRGGRGTRRGGGAAAERRVVQEEGERGVALLALDGGALPPFQLPSARRQYMQEDNYQVDKSQEFENIPGLNSYEEIPIHGYEIKPAGLTRSLEDALDYMNSTPDVPHESS